MTNLQGDSPQVLRVLWFPMYTRCRVEYLKTTIHELLVFLCNICIFCFTIWYISHLKKTKHNCLQEQKITPWKYIRVYKLLFCLGLLGFDL